MIGSDQRFRGFNLTILQLPQSVFYTNQTVLQQEAHALRSLRHVRFVLTTRAEASYKIATEGMQLPNVMAIPDIACSAGPVLGSDHPLYDIVLMPRSDREARITPHMAADIVHRAAQAAGLTYK